MLTIILIFRVILSPVANVYQKILANKGAYSVFVVFITYLFLGLFLAPFAFFIKYGVIEKGFWLFIIVASILDGAGNILLVKSLETTELSVFGPINSLKPAIALLISVVLLKEIPTAYGGAGVFLIITGTVIITYKKTAKTKISKGVVYRIVGILFSSLGAVFSKKAINLSSPEITLIFWTLIVSPIMLIALFADVNKIKQNITIMIENKRNYLLLIIFYSLMQYFTLLCFKYTLVGYSLAIFQLSSVVSIILGYKYFNEKGMKKKIICSGIMIFGALLILLK